MSTHVKHECPSQAELDQYVWGALSEERNGAVRQHVEDCTACRNLVERLRQNRDLAAEYQAFFRDDSTVLLGKDGDSGTWDSSSGDPTPCDETATIASGAIRAGASRRDDFPVIAGYEIVREINRGGQGVVFEAIQRSTGRTVAIKTMLGRHLIDERMKWRFEQEVKLVAGIKHSNIVTIHDSGTEEGIHYYVMEYVDGQPLDTYIRLNNPSVRETIRLFIMVCEGVGVAHRHGVIHRDLKPSNILVNQEGVPQVLDFGLAKVVGEKSRIIEGRPVTENGNIMGTLRYMSPEQTLGDPDAVDASSDIYSLGVILYEILLRVNPYKTDLSDIYEAITNIREAEPRRPSKIRSDVDRDVDAVLLRALEKDSQRRYGSVAEFQSDLIAWMQGCPVMARSASSLYVLRKIATKHWMESFVAGLIFVILVSAASIAFQGWRAKKAGDQQFQKGVTIVNSQRGLLDQEYQAGLTQTRKQVLATFLWMMSQGYHDSADTLRHKLNEGTIERVATDYLLEENFADDRLIHELGSENRPMALFLIGEKRYLQGKKEEAKQAFEAVLRSKPAQKDWIELSEARLDDMAGGNADSEPN